MNRLSALSRLLTTAVALGMLTQIASLTYYLPKEFQPRVVNLPLICWLNLPTTDRLRLFFREIIRALIKRALLLFLRYASAPQHGIKLNCQRACRQHNFCLF